jgi:citrate lyase gamma subunit
MFSNFERIVKVVYQEWKAAVTGALDKEHPSEEVLVCFLEDKLSQADKDVTQSHLLKCNKCSEYLSTQLKIEPHLSKDVPVSLLEKVKRNIGSDIKDNIFEIVLKLKDKSWEIIQTSGDVLVGQELIPAPVLRSRQINEFKEEVDILKDLHELRILARLESKSSKIFGLAVEVKNKQGKKIHKDLRVTLIKDEVELESYVSDIGNSVFENISPGDYRVEIIQEAHLAAIIDLKVKA